MIVPDAVQDAQRDAIKADKDRQRYQQDAETYRNDVLPRARGAAAKEVLDAEAYRLQVLALAQGDTARFDQVLAQYEHAPAVTRERMYLETMENVYKNSRKVIVDTKNGNSMMYLPLDKLISPGPQSISMPNDTMTVPAGAGPRDAGGAARGSGACARSALMQNRMLYTLLGLVAVILVVRASVFTVSEGQLAIKSIGGEIVDSNFEPGLHFRIPLVEEVSRFDKRIITQLYRQEPFLTREQEQLKVDFYVKWRIDNLRRFYEATGGTEEVANDRLGETIKDSIKTRGDPAHAAAGGHRGPR